jgi:hypothetical protein
MSALQLAFLLLPESFHLQTMHATLAEMEARDEIGARGEGQIRV